MPRTMHTNVWTQDISDAVSEEEIGVAVSAINWRANNWFNLLLRQGELCSADMISRNIVRHDDTLVVAVTYMSSSPSPFPNEKAEPTPSRRRRR